jgi:peptide-methionine (S)-S-oxide reductase
LPGVVATAVGYAGGTTVRPTYEDVCSHATGHAEVVEVQFDPTQVSYDTLLELFWANHDPTTPNRQGPNIGSQYRSVIFYHDESQREAAQHAIDLLNQSGRYRRPIVTQVVPAPTFWRAEDYHQQYLEKRGWAACAVR